ncbi:MAG TPA: aspartate kinase [Eubacteriaceae bacterium]|nr:aspartate kinase [Eubacteriaceae bacterium]
MKIIIQKFGGSSLATLELRENIVQKVREAKERSINPVIVVSAMGRKGEPYATDTLIDMVNQYKPMPRNLDLLMACGEIISSVTIASYLKDRGWDTIPLTGGQAGIITDNHYGKANIINIDTQLLLNILKEGKIPVVAGFQGITKEGNITTLGRGGSDVTAAILGEALKADSIEIYTDVDGVMTADPILMPSAKVLSAIDYNEVLELAEYGAKVIHPRAIEISMRSNIPIYIKNATTNSPGTLITNYNKINLQKTLRYPVVTGIAHISDRAQIKVKTDNNEDFFDPLFFTEIANNNISIDLINLFPEEKVFIIDKKDISKVEEILKENKYQYNIIDNCCKVTAIGSGMRGVPGVMARIVSALHREDIQILQTADSHTTISCLVKEEDTKAAIRVLHEEFNLG